MLILSPRGLWERLLLEHERRLVRLETVADIKRLGPPKRK
jgi:hypothetical protein